MRSVVWSLQHFVPEHDLNSFKFSVYLYSPAKCLSWSRDLAFGTTIRLKFPFVHKKYPNLTGSVPGNSPRAFVISRWWSLSILGRLNVLISHQVEAQNACLVPWVSVMVILILLSSAHTEFRQYFPEKSTLKPPALLKVFKVMLLSFFMHLLLCFCFHCCCRVYVWKSSIHCTVCIHYYVFNRQINNLNDLQQYL